MDGDSSDASAEILEGTGDSVRWRSEPDSGQAEAINKAYAESTGEIIGWLNSDDAYFDCKIVQDVVDFFGRYPEVDVAYGHAVQLAEDGTIIQLLWANKFDSDLLKTVDIISQPAAFIRRSALSERMLDESFHFAMDYELWLRLDREGRRFRRMDRIVAVDRHQQSRKSSTIKDVHAGDIARLASMYGTNVSSEYDRRRQMYYVRQRLMGATLIPRVSSRTAIGLPPHAKSGLLRRQMFSRRRDWPEVYR